MNLITTDMKKKFEIFSSILVNSYVITDLNIKMRGDTEKLFTFKRNMTVYHQYDFQYNQIIKKVYYFHKRNMTEHLCFG